MRLRQTHTLAQLEVSPEAYAEIRAKLVAAGYDHALDKDHGAEMIDMSGIALMAGPPAVFALGEQCPKCGALPDPLAEDEDPA